MRQLAKVSVSATCLIKNLKQWSLRPGVEFDQGTAAGILSGLSVCRSAVLSNVESLRRGGGGVVT